MHITEIDVLDVPPLEDIDINCHERVNMFIGPNASGKSTILRAVKTLHSLALRGEDPLLVHFTGPQGDGSIIYRDEDNYPSPGGGLAFSMKPSLDWPRDEDGRARWNEVPFLYIPATRISLPPQRIFDPLSLNHMTEHLENVDAETMLNRLFDTESNVFDGRLVEWSIDRLRQEMSGDRGKQNELRRALSLAYSCVQSICSEIISDSSPHSYVDQYEAPDSRRVVHYGMGIGTNDAAYNTEQPLYAGALSSGTQGTLLWVYALALKMGQHYGFEGFWDGQGDKPAILLIDEIENHLHPTWQRRVIPSLLHYFSGLQIIATTHSPFVVAGLRAGQVHLLRRDGPPTTNTEDIVGWTADEILRNMMGVDDPTDNETAEAARELRQLRSEGPRSSPEEEQDRQERMQELRQRVDRDLLAGGPWKKQRELFEEQFAEALQKYRESKDMNQENG